MVLRDPRRFEPLVAFPAWSGAIKEIAFDATSSRLAISGNDVDISVWDLGLVRDGLSAIGLAWDRPAPVLAPADAHLAPRRPPSATVPIVGRADQDMAAAQEARRLRASGVQSYQAGHLAGAIRDLERARDLFHRLSRARPADEELMGTLANTSGFLGSSLLADRRPIEARRPRRVAGPPGRARRPDGRLALRPVLHLQPAFRDRQPRPVLAGPR